MRTKFNQNRKLTMSKASDNLTTSSNPITNDDSGEKLIGTFEKIKADGIEMIKKFMKGVAILATAGVLYDSASKIERLSKFKTILSEGYSDEDIECIDNLLREDCCVYYQGTTYIQGSKKLLKRLAIIITIN